MDIQIFFYCLRIYIPTISFIRHEVPTNKYIRTFLGRQILWCSMGWQIIEDHHKIKNMCNYNLSHLRAAYFNFLRDGSIVDVALSLYQSIMASIAIAAVEQSSLRMNNS